jgi:hypothetical protein
MHDVAPDQERIVFRREQPAGVAWSVTGVSAG